MLLRSRPCGSGMWLYTYPCAGCAALYYPVCKRPAGSRVAMIRSRATGWFERRRRRAPVRDDMKSDFEEIWSDIRQRLLPGTLVRYWNAEEGYLGGSFRVDGADDAAMIIRHPQMGHKRQIPRRELRQLFAFWDAYNSGAIDRLELDKKSQNAAYVLSILKWQDDTQIPATRILARADSVSPGIGITPGAAVQNSFANDHEYGQQVLQAATEGRAALYGPSVEIDYGAGLPAHVFATVGNIVIDIESKVEKQLRGAVLDLLFHSYPKKLLILVTDQTTIREVAAEQCRHIMRRFIPESSFRVLVLKGSSSSARLSDDAADLAAVLADLGNGG
jgi:hypothetical protein